MRALVLFIMMLVSVFFCETTSFAQAAGDTNQTATQPLMASPFKFTQRGQSSSLATRVPRRPGGTRVSVVERSIACTRRSSARRLQN